MESYIRIHPKDNVAVALVPLAPDSVITLEETKLTVLEEVLAGHKVALEAIAEGESIIKYGSPIGIAKKPIKAGEWVHTHNIKTNLDGIITYQYQPEIGTLPSIPTKTFQGFRREDGRVGVRNYLWIIPTVGCVNHIATNLATLAGKLPGAEELDGVVAFPHPYGCSQMGEDQENTRIILSDLAKHPNAGAVLLLGLGCENSGVNELKSYLGDFDESRIQFLVCQDVQDEIEAGLEILAQLISRAKSYTRSAIPVSELIVGLKCGGSDGFSGITANPTVGRFSDRLVAAGGTTILTEVPEMFGAEQLLMNRCVSPEVFEKTVTLINDFKEYFIACGQTIYENPSPGNKAGGISTLEDKSLGCTQKSGEAPISDVLNYGEVVKTRGLNLLSSPGNDLVAATALAASGAHIVLFTTGRGTPFASPVPTVKISSNPTLAANKPGWIDFDASLVLTGTSLDEMGERLFNKVVEIASGEKVKSEHMGLHDLAIFKKGVTL